MHAIGVTDLRSILAVRRAFQLIPLQMERVDSKRTHDWEDSAEFWMHVERHESDNEDRGGEDGLTRTTDKATLRMRRSFELLMTSGRVVRFEVSFPSSFLCIPWLSPILDSFLFGGSRMDNSPSTTDLLLEKETSSRCTAGNGSLPFRRWQTKVNPSASSGQGRRSTGSTPRSRCILTRAQRVL